MKKKTHYSTKILWKGTRADISIDGGRFRDTYTYFYVLEKLIELLMLILRCILKSNK